MRKYLTQLAVAAAALVSVGVAQAVVLDFDHAIDTSFAPFAPLLNHTSEMQTQGYWVDMFSTKSGATAGDLVGALIDGADLSSYCVGLVCPTNNSTHFLAALNDGLPDIGRLDGATFKVTKFDASFIAASGDVVLPTALLLRVEGYGPTSLLVSEDIYLPGPVAGAYSFATYTLGAAFANTAINEIAFRGYACTTPTTCTRSLDKAQFGIDNITAVPEPSAWLMLGVGLIGVGAMVRRRSAA